MTVQPEKQVCPYPGYPGYPGCDVSLGDIKNGMCPKCHRVFWICPSESCGAVNRATSIFCQMCGKRHQLKTSWPQEGGDSGRTFRSSSANISYYLLERSWSSRLDRGVGGDVQIDRVFPSPVLVEDLVILYNPWTESFEARNIKKKGHLVWQCRVHRNDITQSGSPMCCGGSMFFVTVNPNYIHCVAVDSGLRRIYGIDIGNSDSDLDKIPGNILGYSGPVMVKKPPFVSAEVEWLMCLITTEGVVVVELPNTPKQENHTLRGAFLPQSFQRHMWTKPVLVKHFLVASSSVMPEVLVCDLSRYPDFKEQDVQIKPVTDIPATFNRISPCVLMGAWDTYDVALFCASSDAQAQTMMVQFTPNDRPFSTTVMYEGNALGKRSAYNPPVTNGEYVYLRYYDCGKNKIGLAEVGQDGHPLPLECDLPEYFDFIRSDSDRAVMFDVDAPYVVLPYSRPPQPAIRQASYSDDLSGQKPVVKPIIVDGNVFVQTQNCVTCYKLTQ